jgi:glycine/D-amino acid oxidase-like deaminating enzyme
MKVSDAMTAGWYEAARVAARERPRLNFDLDVDVCVIGAGIAGLTVAREVARRGWSVAVLEAATVASGESGRNIGFVLPGFGAPIEDIVERVGLDHAKQLWALSEQGVDYVRAAIDGNAMPGVNAAGGWLDVSKTDNAPMRRGFVERLRWIGADVEFWPAERVRELLVTPRYFNAVHYRRAFHLHPLNYALGLAAVAEAAGARIFEGTAVRSIDTAGVRKRVETPEGRVRAAHVVLAANTGLADVVPRLAATLLPVSTCILVTEPIGNLAEAVRYAGAVSEAGGGRYRIVDGNRLQWSGGMRVWPADPRRIGKGLVAGIRRDFPMLGKIEIASLWRCTQGRTVHRMPQIGEIERGIWATSGFGGHGLNLPAIAGELVARGIVDNDQTWRIFAPYELVWAGGTLGRAFAQASAFAAQPVRWTAESWSRYRERARARRQARKAAKLAFSHPVVARAAALEAAALIPPPSNEPPAGVPERRRYRGKKPAPKAAAEAGGAENG